MNYHSSPKRVAQQETGSRRIAPASDVLQCLIRTLPPEHGLAIEPLTRAFCLHMRVRVRGFSGLTFPYLWLIQTFRRIFGEVIEHIVFVERLDTGVPKYQLAQA